MVEKIVKTFKMIFFLLILVGAYYFSFKLISQPMINKSEAYLMQTGLDVMTAGFNQRISHVEVLGSDWSYWDDLYNYMSSPNQAFVDKELTDETLSNMGLNMILLYNNNGYLTLKKTTKLNQWQQVDIPSQLLDSTGADSLQPEIKNIAIAKQGSSGLIHTDRGNLIYSIYPILPSNGEGSSHGTILMGRYLNDEDTKIIRAGVGLDLKLVDYYNLPPEVNDKLKGKETLFEKTATTTTAYKVFKDTFGTPALYVELIYPRIIYQACMEATFLFVVVATLFTTISFVIVRKILK